MGRYVFAHCDPHALNRAGMRCSASIEHALSGIKGGALRDQKLEVSEMEVYGG